MPYKIDEDPEVQKDISELEALATNIKRSADLCEMTDIFLDNLGIIGSIHRKYTRFTFLQKDSESAKRFDDAIRKAREAKIAFIRDCECKYRKKIY